MKLVSEKYLDELWRQIVRLMYNGRCAKCRGEGTECHHHIRRADHRHRWHPLNGVLLCFMCHKWAHEKPLEFNEWLKRRLPAIHLHGCTPNEGGYDPHYRLRIKHELQGILCHLTRKTGHQTLSFMPMVALICVILYVLAYLFMPREG